jgi:transcriptional regulator with XRE-family HTH domain
VLAPYQEFKMPTPLGDKIRSLRQAKELTLDALAKAAEMSKSYLWELETSDDTNPTKDILEKLAKPLEVTAEFLANDGQVEATANDFDKAFFRNFRELDEETKRKLNDIMKALKG